MGIDSPQYDSVCRFIFSQSRRVYTNVHTNENVFQLQVGLALWASYENVLHLPLHYFQGIKNSKWFTWFNFQRPKEVCVCVSRNIMLNWQVPMILKITHWTAVNMRQQENWKIDQSRRWEREKKAMKRKVKEGGRPIDCSFDLSAHTKPPFLKKKKKKHPSPIQPELYCINCPLPCPPPAVLAPSQPPTPHGWTADELELGTKSSRRASNNRTPTAKERKVLSVSHFLPH